MFSIMPGATIPSLDPDCVSQGTTLQSQPLIFLGKCVFEGFIHTFISLVDPQMLIEWQQQLIPCFL